MEEFQVKILASDHPFYEGKCYSLVIPTCLLYTSDAADE